MMIAQRWWTPWRTVDDITILHVDLAPVPDREKQAVTLLDDSERARWMRSKSVEVRYAFALCRSALRISLGEHTGCENDALSFAHMEHGKPFALIGDTRPGVGFNVSHSGTHGLIAIGRDRDLGVDVEERSLARDVAGLSRRVYGPRERQCLAGLAGAARIHLFYRLWTMKEALLKAIGTGLSLGPGDFEVPDTALDGARTCSFRFPHDAAPPLRLVDLGEERFAAAVASRPGSRIP